MPICLCDKLAFNLIEQYKYNAVNSCKILILRRLTIRQFDIQIVNPPLSKIVFRKWGIHNFEQNILPNQHHATIFRVRAKEVVGVVAFPFRAVYKACFYFIDINSGAQ